MMFGRNQDGFHARAPNVGDRRIGVLDRSRAGRLLSPHPRPISSAAPSNDRTQILPLDSLARSRVLACNTAAPVDGGQAPGRFPAVPDDNATTNFLAAPPAIEPDLRKTATTTRERCEHMSRESGTLIAACAVPSAEAGIELKAVVHLRRSAKKVR
jgi:hypothetical protein